METAAEVTPCPWTKTLLGGKEAHSTTTEHREQAGNVHRLPVCLKQQHLYAKDGGDLCDIKSNDFLLSK